MATASLALQWSPPPSSPLFEDPSQPQQQQQHTHQQHQASTSRRPSPSNSVAHSSLAPSPQQSQQPFSSFTTSRPPSSGAPSSTGPAPGGSGIGSSSASSYFPTGAQNLAASPPNIGAARTPSPRPRSYAAAAAAAGSPTLSAQQQQVPQYPTQHQPYPSQQQQQQQRFAQHQPVWTPQSFQMPQQAFSGAPQGQHRPQNPFGPPQGQPHYGHNNPGFQPAYNIAFAPPTMPNQYAWAQYQQMLATQAVQFHQQTQTQMYHSPAASAPNSAVGASSGRERSSSGTQRPSHLGYNDSFQAAHSGASYSSVAGSTDAVPRSGLPPGAMAPPSSSAQNSSAFHPYRRQITPQGTSSGTSSPSQAASQQLLPPPAQRQRTPSADSAHSATGHRAQSPGTVISGNVSHAPARVIPQASPSSNMAASESNFTIRRPAPPSRTESTRSCSSGIGTNPNGSDSSLPHSRQDSTSSQNSSVHSSAAVSDKASTVGGRSTPTPTYKKPSPLSRQPAPREDDDNDTNADYGGSDRDDVSANGRATPTPSAEKKKSLGGKLRKALSLTTVNEMQQQTSNNASLNSRPSAAPSGRTIPPSAPKGRFVSAPSSATIPRPPSPSQFEFGAGGGMGSSSASISSRRAARPPLSNSAGAATADGNGKRSLFNRKFNSSTDNISISSTVSSASVMLRKVGNLGKMARRHSLMGLTNMFNKDKEGRDTGREGLQGDDFGTVASSASAADMSRASSGSQKGKSGPATASVSHATVELDTHVGDGNMTPAAHYVRQHQIQMRKQAEAEEKAARERKEAEARSSASVASTKGKLGSGKTTDDVVESRQKMIEKEKERLKSKRTWRNRLRVGGGSSVDLTGPPSSNGLETIPVSVDGEPDADSGFKDPAAILPGSFPSSRSMPNISSHFPQDSISGGVGAGGAYLDEQELAPPHMPAAGGGEESSDEFETDSLRHWGEGIERSRASAALVKAPKGILKKSASSSQLNHFMAVSDGGMASSFERPFARVRASSYDAPQAAPAAGAPMLSALSTTTEGVDRMDGVARQGSSSPESQRRPASSGDEHGAGSSLQAAAPSVSAFGHHSNSSMPTLTMMTNPTTGALPSPSHRPSIQRKRICFTEEHIYHSTWPAHVYDRRGELATCNRLTPLLAQRIKEELNSFKMEEMEVAPSSRIYTHFFV